MRELCRLKFGERITILTDVADGLIEAEVGERLKAVDMLGKYGGIEKISLEVEDVTPQHAGTGDEVMGRIALMVGRAFVSATKQARTAMLKDIQEAELVLE